MDDAVIPYTLPEVKDHSFFFISQHIAPSIEAKMHRHDAWELYFVTHGNGVRMTGGQILPSEALKYGSGSSVEIKHSLMRMKDLDDIGQLSEMIHLLPIIFTTKDHTLIGKPIKIERDIRRMQRVTEYVMAHYIHNISLDDIAAHIGMNRSAFCTFFRRNKGMTFSQFVTQYRLETACELLKTSQKQVSEICFAVGFNDLPHFIRVFNKETGLSPTKYRKQARKMS